MVFSVRLAAPDEAALVHSVTLAAYAEHKGALPVESSAHDESVEDIVAVMEVGGAVVASDDMQVVGSARFLPEDEYLYVGRVAVLPSHRRRGVASSMMRFLEDVARRSGRSAMRVGVRDSLPSNVRFYESLGYEVVSVDPHARGPDRVLTMVKTLPT